MGKALDPLDRRILFELDKNSRRSFSQLGRILRKTRDRVEYRYHRLVDQGILKGATVSVDPLRLGLRAYKTYLRLENQRPRVAQFIRYLERHPRVYWLAQCEGSWDLMIVVLATDARDFHQVHTTMLSEFNEIVLNFTSYSLVELRFYGRGYLAPQRERFSYPWGQRSNEIVDRTDLEILKVLSEDARLPTAGIAERTGLAPHLVRYRIQRMEDLKIIIGYHVNIDYKQLGILSFKTQFFLRSYDIKLREELLTYCSRSPHITCVVQQVGDCNFEIEMEVEYLEQHYALIEDIRGNSSKLVRNFQSILFREAAFFPVSADMDLILGNLNQQHATIPQVPS